MFKLLRRFLLLFKKCEHPKQYRQSAWKVPPPPKGIDVYWCRICKQTYTVEVKVKSIKKEETK